MTFSPNSLKKAAVYSDFCPYSLATAKSSRANASVVFSIKIIILREVNIQSHDGIFEGNISLYVKDAEGLHDIMDKIRKIKGIESVKRSLN